MARKRTRNYRELREHFDEAERREGEEAEEEDDDEEDDDDDEEEEGDEEEEEGAGGEEGEEDEDGAPIVKKKKKKEKAAPKPRARRTRTKAAARMKMVWGVFNNSNTRVASYEYKERQAAIDHAARLTASKPNNTHFIQPVKEPMEVKVVEEKVKG